MKLPCTVIEDMLPLYIDGICADETEALVEEHLCQCPKCCDMMEKMRTTMALPEEPENLKPLQAIQKQWEKSKRTALQKGICLALAALVLVVSVLSGVWYGSYGKYYYRIAQHMDPVPEEAVDMGSADGMKEIGGYRIGVWIPPVLSNSGFIRVTAENGRVLFVYPQVGGGYEYRVSVLEDQNHSYFIWLYDDLTANYEDHPLPARTESERARIDQLLVEQKEEIQAILAAVNLLLEG